MDLKPLVSLFKDHSRLPATKNHQMVLLMSLYDYSIIYKPGTNIVAAVAMNLQENLQVPTPGCIIHLKNHMDDTTMDSTNIRRRTSKDPVLSKVYQAVRPGKNLPKESPQLSVSYSDTN